MAPVEQQPETFPMSVVPMPESPMTGSLTEFWIKWLKGWSLFVAAFGLVYAMYDLPFLGKPGRWFMDYAFLRAFGTQSPMTPETVLSNGVLGAVTFGWGVFMWSVVEPLAKHDPAALRRAFTLTFTAWYVVDQWASWRAGAFGNMLSNTLFYGAFMLPFLTRHIGHFATK
jgi:hypothetical protein